jgi:DNA-binding transcriptional MerR regulator
MKTETPLYPIREVSRLTGVNAITLRAWERRYGLFEPVRSESGHRLFTQENIERIKKAVALTEQGVPISQVKKLLDAEPRQQALSNEEKSDLDYQNAILQAVVAGDLIQLNRELDAAFSDLDDAALNLTCRRVTLTLLEKEAEFMSFWSSQAMPRLYTRLRMAMRRLDPASAPRIWIQASNHRTPEPLPLLCGMHFTQAGLYPLIQTFGIEPEEKLFSALQKFQCKALAVVDASGEMPAEVWLQWMQAHPSVDFYYCVNQDSIEKLSAHLSSHYLSLRADF